MKNQEPELRVAGELWEAGADFGASDFAESVFEESGFAESDFVESADADDESPAEEASLPPFPPVARDAGPEVPFP